MGGALGWLYRGSNYQRAASWGWGDELTIKPCSRLELSLEPREEIHPSKGKCVWGGHAHSIPLLLHLTPPRPFSGPREWEWV